MAFDARAVVVLVASPSDTAVERAVVVDVLARWNSERANTTGIVTVPALLGRPPVTEDYLSPDAADKRLVDIGDVLLGVFWTRLATTTSSASWTTAAEINQFVDMGKPAALFFSNRPAEQGTVDVAQLDALHDLRDALAERVPVFEFGEIEELRSQVGEFVDKTLPAVASAQIGAQAPAAPAYTSLNGRAELTASVTSENRPGSNLSVRDWYITVTNSGRGAATAATVELEPSAGAEEPWRILEPEPVQRLEANAECRFYLVVPIGSVRTCDVTLRWRNEDGSHGMSRQTLSV